MTRLEEIAAGMFYIAITAAGIAFACGWNPFYTAVVL